MKGEAILMKFKKITATLLLVLTLLSLCSCDMLDELKQQRAYFTDDTQNSIIYNGETYKKANVSDKYSSELNGTVYIVEKDVPVLLSAMLCEHQAELSVDGNFIFLDFGTIIYVKESCYDAFLQMLQTPPDRYLMGIEYFDGIEAVVLSEDAVSAINDIIETVVARSLPESSYYVKSIYKSYENFMIYDNTDTIDIYENFGDLYLTLSEEYKDDTCYKIPDEYKNLF